MKRGFWTSHRWVALAATVVALAATYATPIQRLEASGLRWARHLLPGATPGGEVAVVAIDAPSLAELGDWPWPRDRLAQLVRRLDRDGARAIGLLLPLETAQTPPGLADLRRALPEDRRPAWLARLDTDRTLAKALAESGNVVLKADVRPAGASAPVSSDTPGLWRAQGLAGTGARALLLGGPRPAARTLQPPLPQLAEAAAAVGAWPARTHAGGGVPLAVPVGHNGDHAAGFVLRLAGLAEGLGDSPFQVVPQRGVKLGAAFYPTDPDLVFHPRPWGEPRPPRYSAAEVLTGGGIDVKGRSVVVGLTAARARPGRSPADPGLPPLDHAALGLAGVLAGTGIATPAWFYAAQRGLVLLLGLYLLLLPARAHDRATPLVGLALAVVLANVGVGALLTRSLWLPTVVPGAFVLAGHGLLWTTRRIGRSITHARAEAAEAYRELGVNLQSQGQLDRAFDVLRRCGRQRAALPALYDLGRDFERRRQFNRAAEVYDYLAYIEPDYKDVGERRRSLSSVSERFPGSGGLAAASTLVLDNPAVEKPMLGRYQLERELGRGAMGMVYLGTDPRIGRAVAIKTLALSEEFEGRQLEAARERFFREAEAVGRLDHPDIVTIYDAGEEHDLAYIAMDFVDGESLDAFTAPDALLPIDEVLEIGARVAEALDYAHAKQVIHRDIKPANVIYNRASDTLKITDFGVASLTDNSRTRTGSLLGSPAYMSPEQLGGRDLDGRSDLFSLGVTLYQLFTAELPFEGESLATLTYRITNQRHPDIRKKRAELPSCVTRIINKLLQKDAGKRYASGSDAAAALRRCAGNTPSAQRRSRR